MAQRAVGLLALLTVGSGCATTMTVSQPVQPTDPAVAYVNTAGSEHPAFIRTRGASLLAPRLSMTTDALLVHDVGQEEGTVPLSDVRSILFRDRGRGAVEGALVGLGVSTALGLKAAIDDDSPFSSGSDGFLLITAIASLATVPLGAILGSLIGHRTTIEVGPVN